jgi:hypothetical protein
MIGSWTDCGRSDRIWPTDSRTSLVARSGLTPILNSTVVVDTPSLIVERMFLTPARPEIDPSTLRVIWLSISAGAALGWVTATVTIGNDRLGLALTGRRMKAAMPASVATTNRTMVGTGLRIAQADMLLIMA